MLAHRLVDRPTRDVDLFSPQQADLAAAADHPRAELTRRGHHLAEGRRTDTLVELTVVTADGRAVGVQLAVEARRREPGPLDIGPVCCIPRSWPPTRPSPCSTGPPPAISSTSPHWPTAIGCRSCWPGPRTRTPDSVCPSSPSAVGRAAARPDRDYTRLGLSPTALTELRRRAVDWQNLLVANGPPGRAGGHRPGPDPPPPESPGVQPALTPGPPLPAAVPMSSLPSIYRTR